METIERCNHCGGEIVLKRGRVHIYAPPPYLLYADCPHCGKEAYFEPTKERMKVLGVKVISVNGND